MNFVLRLLVMVCGFTLVSTSLPQTNPASAKVRISERTKYYSVRGKTGKQLFKSIVRRGPKTKRDGHAVATTDTKIKVKNIKIGIKGRHCVVERADVIVSLTYTFPRWRGNRRASAKLRKNWDKFNRQVQKHEATHGRISREYARKLHTRLRKLSGRVSKGCADFGRRSSRSIKLIQKSFFRRHRGFDKREGRASARIRRLQKALLISK